MSGDQVPIGDWPDHLSGTVPQPVEPGTAEAADRIRAAVADQLSDLEATTRAAVRAAIPHEPGEQA
ncbi:hypothetical protein ACFXGA_05820 [Actinosynnema sp. NPDC059335]|uniref:hypothetical protein n=1 Tax=Actinosynnema sp. NPDC059335 TaxID=3346804 RepID=UPI003671E598